MAIAAPPGLPVRLKSVGDNDSASYPVQFGGPVESEWVASLRGAAAQIVEYLPDFAFEVWMGLGGAREYDASTRTVAVADTGIGGYYPLGLATLFRQAYNDGVPSGYASTGRDNIGAPSNLDNGAACP